MSASEALSQGEIDKILRGEHAASTGKAARSGNAVISTYDFRRARHVSKERLRTLDAMYERLVKSLEAWLVGRMRRPIEIRLQSIEQFVFGEFTMSLPMPCASFSFDILNNPGQRGVIDMGHDFAYMLVDRFFGGTGTSQSMGRPLSPIERLTVRMVVERVTMLLSEIWQDFVAFDLEISSFESSPEMVQGPGRDDPVLVASIEVTVDSGTSLLLICLPLSVLDKFFSGADQQRVKRMTGSELERKETRAIAEASLRVTQVDVVARLPDFHIPMHALLELSVGSVLSTPISVDASLEVHIPGMNRYLAESGRVGRKLAVRIIDPPSAVAPPPATLVS